MKTIIECLRGATEQTIGGITYSFDRDEYGRFVNEVNSVLHRSIFLNVEHYREVPLDPPPPDDAQEIPPFLSGQGATSEGEGTGDDADDDNGLIAGDETNALNSDEQKGGEQPEQAPVAASTNKAANKSK